MFDQPSTGRAIIAHMDAGNERSALRRTFSRPVMRSSLAVCLVVGTILNLINQGDRLDAPETIEWWKVCLTYCVPFCVSTYGSFMAIRMFDKRTHAKNTGR